MRGVWFLWVISAFATTGASAAQRARVITENALVYATPAAASDPLAMYHNGTTLYISSQFLRGSDGVVWYKAFIDSGKYGYVRGGDLVTEADSKSLQAVGVGQSSVITEESSVWTFALRALGIGGALLSTQSPLVGADGEFTFCVPFWVKTAARHVVALGAFAQWLSPEPVVGPSIVIRIPTLGRAVPEFRLRGAMALPSRLMLAGGNFGVQYPFSMNPGFHVSGYMEAGALAGVVPTGSVYAWAAAGLGLHF